MLPRILEAFEQGRADLRSRAGGLGLGLAISQLLVEAHQGRLTAESPGRGLGSTFRLELETVRAPAQLPDVGPSPPALDAGLRGTCCSWTTTPTRSDIWP